MLWSLAVLALLASVQGRAVNISNTWVLPEEGFPVFYRYFRDRISWYEADAVCQFHHANLVTVDTTAQYDALRAYLKELDISSAVWVGLIRSNPDGDFTWTDYRGLSGDGYWSSAPDTRSAPLCAASDPTADYRWEARACGGPMVASFICELPVPQWASGSEGCMVRQIPALTILYLPESAAVQLTADCGLAGVKRVQCTGNIKREELLNNLSCGEPPEDLTTIFASEATISTASPETVTDLDTSQEEINGETNTTEREDVTQQERVQLTPIPNLSETKKQNLLNRISFSKDINLNMIHDNNLESNDIPKIANQNDNGLSEEEVTRLEDEKHMQHKILHNEYARLGNIGNFENIFSQPADHFVPPLVMAKARISDDMTVLSLEEKHAQQLAEQRNRNYEDLNFRPEPYAREPPTTEKSTTTEKISTSEKPLIVSTPAFKTKDSKKYSSSKKYNEKYAEPKNRNMKTLEKSIKLIEKATTTQPSTTVKIVELTTTDKSIEKKPNVAEEDSSIDLSVIIREQADDKAVATTKNLPNKQTYSSTTQASKEASIDKVSMKTTQNSNIDTQTEATQEMTHEVIKITILDEAKATVNPIVFEITTKVPVTEKSSTPNDIVETTPKPHLTTKKITTTPIVNTDTVTVRKIETATSTQSEVSATTAKLESVSSSTQIPVDKVHIEEIATTPNTHSSSTHEIEVTTVIVSGPTINNTTSSNATTANGDSMASTTQKPIEKTDIHANTTEDGIDDKLEEIHDGYDTSTHLEEAIDDLDSPLLSAANEPLHRPNRSRRPQQPPNRNKFNPFRILG